MNTEQLRALERIDHQGGIDALIGQICTDYLLGDLQSYSVIGVGYEDCNVVIRTDRGAYMAKMFAKSRPASEVDRCASTIRHVLEAGIRHPEMLATPGGATVQSIGNVSLVLLRYVDGKTFYELGRVPNTAERLQILEQAAKINTMEYNPPYITDSWAIPNIEVKYKKVHAFMQPEDAQMVAAVLQRYHDIPLGELPRAFVHGDIIKSNVIRGNDGKVYIIDFSASNQYPRIQELAAIAANMLHDDSSLLSLKSRCDVVAAEYSQFAEVADIEREYLYSYALCAIAMELLGGYEQKYIEGIDNDETDFWLRLGREGLRSELTV